MKPSRCFACRELVPDLTRRFVEGVGFCCTECHDFLQAVEKPLRRAGIEGMDATPVRYKPETEKP